jgi:hypothetical protein
MVALTMLLLPVPAGATVGGSSWSVFGPSKVTLPKSGEKPVTFDGNLRLHFDGEEGDEAGTGTIACYDSEGQDLLAEVPMTWTSGKKESFTITPDPESLAGFLETRVQEGTGKATTITLVDIKCKGAVIKKGAAMKHTIAARGTAVLGAGSAVSLKLSLKAKSDIR